MLIYTAHKDSFLMSLLLILPYFIRHIEIERTEYTYGDYLRFKVGNGSWIIHYVRWGKHGVLTRLHTTNVHPIINKFFAQRAKKILIASDNRNHFSFTL